MSRRFLEINHVALVKKRYPEETDYINTEFSTLAEGGMFDRLRAIFKQAGRLLHASLGGTRYELIVCRCFARFIWRRDVFWPVNILRWMMAFLIRLSVWRQTSRGARLAVVDMVDEPTIDKRDLFLLRRCQLYFKRELPQNAWDVFLRVQPAHGEYILLTRDLRWRELLGRMRPFTLGLTLGPPPETPSSPPTAEEKTLDVFFAGAIEHSTVRTRGFPLMADLARRGYRVEAITTRIPHEEFVKRLRSAWLVWSPGGQGWDCFRHYEIGFAGSVPLIDQPCVQRYQPLLDGVHCYYYYSEGEDLCDRVEKALSDKAGLLRMGAAVHQHVTRYFSPEAMGEHIVREMSRDQDVPETV